MVVRAACVVLLAICLACSRGAPAPEASPSPGAFSEGPSEVATAASESPSEAPTETVDLSVPMEDLVVIPDVSGTDAWLTVGETRTIKSFDRWLRDREVSGEAVELARGLDETYGFVSETRAAYVLRQGADGDTPRARQVLVSRFQRDDDGLSQAWCSVDTEGREAEQLGSSRRVQRAVDRLVALPGSCGAVHDLDDGRFQADISFRRGPLIVQVVAIEDSPIRALQALSRTAPRVHERVVELTD